MALTATQLAFFRSKLGSTVDQTDLESRLARLGTEQAVVVEVLEQRLADLTTKPVSFTVPGEYSEDRSANVKVLAAAIEEARSALPVSSHTVRVVKPVFGQR